MFLDCNSFRLALKESQIDLTPPVMGNQLSGIYSGGFLVGVGGGLGNGPSQIVLPEKKIRRYCKVAFSICQIGNTQLLLVQWYQMLTRGQMNNASNKFWRIQVFAKMLKPASLVFRYLYLLYFYLWYHSTIAKWRYCYHIYSYIFHWWNRKHNDAILLLEIWCSSGPVRYC